MAAPGPPKDKESLFICLFKNPFYSLGDDAIISTENNNFIFLKNSLVNLPDTGASEHLSQKCFGR